MSGYVLGAAVEFDLDDIWEYIAADNIDDADRWIGKLFDAFEALGQRPVMGHRREDLTEYPDCSGRSVLTSSFTAPNGGRLRSWQ